LARRIAIKALIIPNPRPAQNCTRPINGYLSGVRWAERFWIPALIPRFFIPKFFQTFFVFRTIRARALPALSVEERSTDDEN
jgi:hypothetical protein